MIQEREVCVEGNVYTVTVSDDETALLAAKTAGRAVVGVWHGEGGQKLSAAEYLVDSPDGADERYLERVVRRHLGLPWMIGESDRLVIREFTSGDIPGVMVEDGDLKPDTVFYTPDKLNAYIRSQYCFYEYGMWALVRKNDKVIVGKAGVFNSEEEDGLELGYHIFTPFRQQGYAVEACRTILYYVRQELDCPVYAAADPANTASLGVLSKLGFVFIRQRYNESGRLRYLYGWNC